MYSGKSILALITARGGSKGVPRKNVRTLCGKPMIVWTIEAAQASSFIDRIIVSTEDEEIAEISRMSGAEIPFMRPMELAQDNTSSVDTVRYTLKKLQFDTGYSPDYILLLQPTSPLRRGEHIDSAVQQLLNARHMYDSLISLTELEHPVYWNRLLDKELKVKEFVPYDKKSGHRRQDFEKIYRTNGAIYLIDTQVFMEKNVFETDATMGFVMDSKSSVDIDTVLDFDFAEMLLNVE